MISDTNEKTEPPPPLTQREMNQFIMLAALPTLERALERLRWLEAEVVSLTAQRDDAFKSAINAALRADDHNADPLAEMWRELSAYQEQADRDGHGPSWRAMCEDRTQGSANAAGWVAKAALRSVAKAEEHASNAALLASWAVMRSRSVSRAASDSIAAIRRAKEGQR
jgi:hypothetical protein